MQTRGKIMRLFSFVSAAIFAFCLAGVSEAALYQLSFEYKYADDLTYSVDTRITLPDTPGAGEFIYGPGDRGDIQPTSIIVTSNNPNSPLLLTPYELCPNECGSGNTKYHLKDGILMTDFITFDGLNFGLNDRPFVSLYFMPHPNNQDLLWGEITIEDHDNCASSCSAGGQVTLTTISAIPLPSALPLYGAGITVMGFIGWRRTRRRNSTKMRDD